MALLEMPENRLNHELRPVVVDINNDFKKGAFEVEQGPCEYQIPDIEVKLNILQVKVFKQKLSEDVHFPDPIQLGALHIHKVENLDVLDVLLQRLRNLIEGPTVRVVVPIFNKTKRKLRESRPVFVIGNVAHFHEQSIQHRPVQNHAVEVEFFIRHDLQFSLKLFLVLKKTKDLRPLILVQSVLVPVLGDHFVFYPESERRVF